MAWQVAAILAVATLAVADARAQSNAGEPLPAFEVASVRITPAASVGDATITPYGTGTYAVTNISLEFLVQVAFDVRLDQISGVEKLGTERYDVAAKAVCASLTKTEAGGLANVLVSPVGRPVIDKTGIPGSYDVKLEYSRDGDVSSPLPSIFTALQEQLGLKLESARVPVEMLVIDHVERVPTEN